MAGIMGLIESAARFSAAQAAVKVAEHEALEIAAQMVEAKAKGYIGHPHEWWAPPLAESTLKRKLKCLMA